MGDLKTESKREGWLYIIRSNRLGLQYSRKRYFVLKDCILKSYKTHPDNDEEVDYLDCSKSGIPRLQDHNAYHFANLGGVHLRLVFDHSTFDGAMKPIRSAPIDSCIRVTDNGRECIQRKVLFIFSLYNTSNQNDQLKLGASSPEEAARWIRSLQDAASKERGIADMNLVPYSKGEWPYLRTCAHSKKHARKFSIDWTSGSSLQTETITSDVIAPNPWKIFGCQNGLRLFKESRDWDSGTRHWDDHPAIMAVSVVDGTSEVVFRTLMSVGASRSEWDFCFYRGSVVEHLDGHNDIIHEQLYSDWFPWGMKRRDLLLRRYWRREDDGTYVILYHSVFHKRCRPQKGYIRACLKSGGYVISPTNQGKQSVVKHMLSVDWKFWKLYLRPTSGRAVTARMLERVAALREMFRCKSGNFSLDYSSSESMRDVVLPQSEEEIKNEIPVPEESSPEEEVERPGSQSASLMDMHDAADEFFDVPEPVDYDHLENEWSIEQSPELQSPNICQPKFTSAACLVKKLHDLAVQTKGYVDLQESIKEESTICYGSTLQNDSTCNLPCTWADGDPSSFLVRGPNYLQDNQKVKATSTLMKLVGVDWLKSEKREDNLASRPGGIVEKYAKCGGSEFFFVINIQVPGNSAYNLALYYMMNTPLEEQLLLQKFVNGDAAFRNGRFKLIPYISKGSWIVKQSVGKKACLIGQALDINYFQGKNYLEVDVDVGSSTVARGVVSLVLGYLNNLVIEMAFLVQGNTADELPECLIGTCRFNNLDAAKAVQVDQQAS